MKDVMKEKKQRLKSYICFAVLLFNCTFVFSFSCKSPNYYGVVHKQQAYCLCFSALMDGYRAKTKEEMQKKCGVAIYHDYGGLYVYWVKAMDIKKTTCTYACAYSTLYSRVNGYMLTCGNVEGLSSPENKDCVFETG